MPGPLTGVTVLDLSRVLAGPWCVQNLGDLGADVIKIERPGLGDDARHWGPPWLADADGAPTRDSTYFLSTNRNKRSIAVDIATPEGQALVCRLVADADVLMENYKVGDLARYGLDWGPLSRINPRLIYCSLTGFGQDGPHASRPGYDYLFQGMTGLMSITGEPDDRPGGGPQRFGVPVVDLFTGMYATIAIVSALHHRHATGTGQHIDVSLFDCALGLGSGPLLNYLANGRIPVRSGTVSPYIAPYAVLPCSDGQLILACANQAQFEAVCRVMGKPEWATDPRFIDNQGRIAHQEELYALLSEVFGTRTGAEWEDILLAVNVPCGPINNYAKVLEHPHVQHRGTIVETPHALGVAVRGVASPMRFSDSPVEYRHAPPLLGQHTRELLVERLGISDEEMDKLEARGVIAGSKEAA